MYAGSATRRGEHDRIKSQLGKERIYANWIKEELQKEAACLELPFSVVFLASFVSRPKWELGLKVYAND